MSEPISVRGLDDRTRETQIEFENSVESVAADRCRLVIDLDVGQEVNIYATVSCNPASSPIESTNHVAADHAAAVQGVSSGIKRAEQERTKIVTSNEQFNAWIDEYGDAAGAVFMVLQAMMGVRFSPTRPQIVFENPLLPPYLHWVRIENLQVPKGSVNLVLRRHPRDFGLNVERKEGDVQLVVIG